MRTSVQRCAAILLSAVALGSVAPSCSATPKSTKPPAPDAKAMLSKVVARAKSGDRREAFAEFTARRPPFYDGDHYVVCVDAGGIVVAHGGFPTYVGAASFFKDVNGRLMAPAILDAAGKGDGSLRYAIQDEETNHAVEHKIGLFARIGDDVCGVVGRDREAPHEANHANDGK